MNEISNSLRVVNVAFKTVRIIDLIKKAVIACAALTCCVFAVRLWRK